MKRTLIAAAGFALFAATGLANAASWSVVVQPGVYGRVEIGDGDVVGDYVDTAYAAAQPPVYLWVPEFPQAQQPGNGWQQPGRGWEGHRSQQTGWQQGSHGNQAQAQAPQAQPVRGSAHGAPEQAPIQNVVYRRDDNHGADQRQWRGQADGHGQFEHGRDVNRDR